MGRCGTAGKRALGVYLALHNHLEERRSGRVHRRWRRVASRTRSESRRASLGRRRTGVVAALVLSALRELHGESREGLQIDLAGLGDTAILRVAETVRALAVRHALAIVVTHDAGAAYVRRADGPDVR